MVSVLVAGEIPPTVLYSLFVLLQAANNEAPAMNAVTAASRKAQVIKGVVVCAFVIYVCEFHKRYCKTIFPLRGKEGA